MATSYDDLLENSKCRALSYLDALDRRRVFPDDTMLDGLAAFNENLPHEGREGQETLDLLDRHGSPATVANMGGRYFGFVVGGSLPVTVAANWLAAAWDQVASSQVTSPVADHIERVAGEWVLDILDLPRGSAVGFVTGATMATFSALAAARHHLLDRQGWNVGEYGLYGAPQITVVVSAEVHVTVLKALNMLGMGQKNIIKIPVDANGAIDVAQVPPLGPNTIVCVQAGNVNSGAFDPIESICAAARAVGAWVHVDGAFGLWARAAPALADMAKGVEKADSWATDGHKWLNTPYDCGVVICRHKRALAGAFSTSAAYLKEEDGAAKDRVPEFSRRARGIEVWAALRTLGRDGVDHLISENCRLARLFAQELSALGLTIHNKVVLNQIVVSCGSASRTAQMIEAMQAEGTCWFGQTEWQGQKASRISISSWKTTEQDIAKSVAAFKKILTLQGNSE
ncbi:pyridoxal phosphate-dependent decarboxylase family protein [Paremcibacter congregatus]|uniref:pyridoxal phosphate-dependent decarboxylase family protein n=1 Tax=Paremcibacter congregatus TaxID=2043170 RepID=UPI0030ED1E0E|tara:strand:+ start:1266 stop:2633 length:1368 start_codon:yes stop_codon:yes gene_type:complete